MACLTCGSDLRYHGREREPIKVGRKREFAWPIKLGRHNKKLWLTGAEIRKYSAVKSVFKTT